MNRNRLSFGLTAAVLTVACGLSWAARKDKDSVIVPGRGLKYLGVGDDAEQALLVWGPPDAVRGGPDLIQLVYKKHHKAHFLLRRKEHKIIEARFDRGYPGRLTNGIGFDARVRDVLRRFGGAKRVVTATLEDTHRCSAGMDRVLYRAVKNGKVLAYKFTTTEGVLLWFDADGRVSQIVAFPASKRGP